MLNGPQALEWATWFRSLVTDKMIPLKSGADPAKDFLNGKSALLYNGTWTALQARDKFGDDALFLPPPDLGTGPKIGGASWQWGISTNCSDTAGAMDYMKFAAADKYVASVSTATTNIPTTAAAAATVKGYEPGGESEVFRDLRREAGRPAAGDAGLPVHRDRVHQDGAGHPQRRRSAEGAGPGRQEHRRQPGIERLLPELIPTLAAGGAQPPAPGAGPLPRKENSP